MKFIFDDDNADKRFAGQEFRAEWGEWDPERGWEPVEGGKTLLIWTDYGWSPFLHPYEDFGKLLVDPETLVF